MSDLIKRLHLTTDLNDKDAGLCVEYDPQTDLHYIFLHRKRINLDKEDMKILISFLIQTT